MAEEPHEHHQHDHDNGDDSHVEQDETQPVDMSDADGDRPIDCIDAISAVFRAVDDACDGLPSTRRRARMAATGIMVWYVIKLGHVHGAERADTARSLERCIAATLWTELYGAEEDIVRAVFDGACHQTVICTPKSSRDYVRATLADIETVILTLAPQIADAVRVSVATAFERVFRHLHHAVDNGLEQDGGTNFTLHNVIQACLDAHQNQTHT